MLIMSFTNSEKEALDLPTIVTGNGEAYPKQWLAVYVRLYHEKKTSARLNTMGIENFLPIQEEIHQWSDRRKKNIQGIDSYDCICSCRCFGTEESA